MMFQTVIGWGLLQKDLLKSLEFPACSVFRLSSHWWLEKAFRQISQGIGREKTDCRLVYMDMVSLRDYWLGLDSIRYTCFLSSLVARMLIPHDFGYVSQSTSLVVRLCDTNAKAERGPSMTKARTKQKFKSHIALHHSSVMLKICNLFLSITNLFFFSQSSQLLVSRKKILTFKPMTFKTYSSPIT